MSARRLLLLAVLHVFITAACAAHGVCTQMWNPADDPLLPEGGHFSLSKPEGKQVCKRELLQQLGLPYTDPWHSLGKFNSTVWA